LIPATDTYILKGKGVEIYEPRFTYHGFRYVEVTGFPGTPTLKNLEGRVINSAVESVGYFTCSNSLINQIHHNIVWGQLSNLYSVPTDCPQRNERNGNGFGGDGQVTAGEAIHNFDMALFYTKWLDDMGDSQITGNGTDKEWLFSTWPPEAGDGPDGNIENISPSPFQYREHFSLSLSRGGGHRLDYGLLTTSLVFISILWGSTNFREAL